MEFQDLVNIIVNNGMAVVIVGFYLYKDFKFNEKLVSTLQSISEKLEQLEK